jgi:hypothetical protein
MNNRDPHGTTAWLVSDDYGLKALDCNAFDVPFGDNCMAGNYCIFYSV